MKYQINPRWAKLAMFSAVFILILTGGCMCDKPCSSSIEVKAIDPDPNTGKYNYYQPGKIKILTWDPVTNFPANPDKDVTGLPLESLRPYLAKVEVTNDSDVEVRGVTVVFYASPIGLFDYPSTPFGAVAVDLRPKSTVWVNCPWFFALPGANPKHLCLAYRIFHPCDTILENNLCFRNVIIKIIHRPFLYHISPFVVSFAELDGPLTFDVEAPNGIRAEVVRGRLAEGPSDVAPEAEPVKELKVTRGKSEELYLVVTNAGAKFKPGETFDVTVKAMAEKRVASEFTIRYQLTEELEEGQPGPEEKEGEGGPEKTR